MALNSCAYTGFMAKAISNKTVYGIITIAQKKDLIMKFAQKTTEFLYYKQFASYAFYLNILYASSLQSKSANIIRLKYGQFFLWAKPKFHVNQIKVKICYFYIFI